MTSATRPIPRLWRLIIASVAVHAGAFGAIWGVLLQHPNLLQEWGSGSHTNAPLLIEDIDPSSPFTSPGKKSLNNAHVKHPASGETSAPSNTDAGSSQRQTQTQTHTQSGNSSETVGATDPYYSAVRSKIQSQVHYTPAIARRRLQGQVHVSLTLLANGSISSLNVSHSSGTAELDQLALTSVQAAAPFPTFQATPPTRKLELPIDFRLH